MSMENIPNVIAWIDVPNAGVEYLRYRIIGDIIKVQMKLKIHPGCYTQIPLFNLHPSFQGKVLISINELVTPDNYLIREFQLKQESFKGE